MEEGFVADHIVLNTVASVWVEGRPEGTFLGKHVVTMSGKTKRQVETYRCVQCGYLESYANAEWPKE
jgi:hypothetical protein